MDPQTPPIEPAKEAPVEPAAVPAATPAPADPPFSPIRKMHWIEVGVAGILIVLILALFFTPFGKRLLNRAYPTADRTLSFALEAAEEVGAYRQSMERKVTFNTNFTQVAKFEGLMTRDRSNMSGTAGLTGFSTLAWAQDAPLAIMNVDGQVYVSDPYDGTFHKVEDGRLTFDPNLVVKRAYPEYLDKLKSAPYGFSFSRSGDALSFSDPKVATLFFDASTYRLKEVRVNDQNELTYRFSYDRVEDDQIEPPQVNGFGDYWARESVLLEVKPANSYEYLWTRWQERFFGCGTCAAPWDDPDKDRLPNILEFVFGGDPNLSASSQGGVDDRAMVENSVNPGTGKRFGLDVYSNARALLALPGPLKIGDLAVREAFRK